MTTREEIIAAAQRYWRRDKWNNEYFDAAGYADFVLASRGAEVQRLQMALADAEALELGTAEKCNQLRAELEAARAEIERLENQVQARDAELWGRTQKILQLEQQLASEQAKNVELLEIAKKGLRHYENRNIAHGTRNPAAIALDEIAATSSDTSALEAIVKKAGEVMRLEAKEMILRELFNSTLRINLINKVCALPAVTLEDLK